MFQSTRPRGARRQGLGSRCACSCFNPRAREGRDISADGDARLYAVSIHAPARGATCGDYESGGVGMSFNPRAREGRDRGVAWCTSDRACFNPRAREGRDTLIGGLFQGGLPVSIHAPARGATVYG